MDDLKQALAEEDKKSRATEPGLESISDYQEAIKDCNNEINLINQVLIESQKKLIDLQSIYTMYTENPELDITDETTRIKKEIDLILSHANELKEKKAMYVDSKSKLLDSLRKYRERFKNSNSDDLKDRRSLIDQYYRAKDEEKKLKDKLTLGIGNNLEIARLNELESSIIPNLERLLGIKKEEPQELENTEDEEFEDEIINEEDGTHLTLKEKFKKHWKKIAAAGAILGGIALAGYMIYQSIKQGQADQAQEFANQIVNGMNVVKDVGDNVAQTAIETAKQTPVYHPTGDVFRTAHDMITNNNALNPNEWFRYDNIMGAFDTKGNLYDVTTIDQVQDLLDQGIDISGVRTGDPSISNETLRYSGYVPLDDIMEKAGGITR